MATVMNAPFHVPSTITPLINKCVCETEVPVHKYCPILVKKPDTKVDE